MGGRQILSFNNLGALGTVKLGKTWENLGIELEFLWVKTFNFSYGTLFCRGEKLGHLDEENYSGKWEINL